MIKTEENPIYQITESDLISFADRLISQAKKLIPPPRKEVGARIVSLDKFLAEYLWIKRPTFYEKAPQGKIPGAGKEGKKWVVDLDVWEQSIRENQIKAAKEIEQEALDHVI